MSTCHAADVQHRASSRRVSLRRRCTSCGSVRYLRLQFCRRANAAVGAGRRRETVVNGPCSSSNLPRRLPNAVPWRIIPARLSSYVVPSQAHRSRFLGVDAAGGEKTDSLQGGWERPVRSGDRAQLRGQRGRDCGLWRRPRPERPASERQDSSERQWERGSRPWQNTYVNNGSFRGEMSLR